MTDSIPTIDPKKAILLVMDYQPAILAHVSQADKLLARVAETIESARQGGLAVGYVRVAFEAADLAAIPPTNKTFKAVADGRLFPSEAPETQVHPALAPQPCDIVVRKVRVGAFSTTDLHLQLREREIDTLILAGIATSGVVLSTLRDGADRDYRLYVLEDACADRDPEVHAVLMQKVFPRQAYVIAAADLTNLLEAR
jgi:nicotinamidase-related amidase